MAKQQKETLEKELGKFMHKVSLQQAVVAEHQKRLASLQQQANEVDQKLSKIDGNGG